jgi:hypothetical protein
MAPSIDGWLVSECENGHERTNDIKLDRKVHTISAIF